MTTSSEKLFELKRTELQFRCTKKQVRDHWASYMRDTDSRKLVLLSEILSFEPVNLYLWNLDLA